MQRLCVEVIRHLASWRGVFVRVGTVQEAIAVASKHVLSHRILSYSIAQPLASLSGLLSAVWV